MKLETFLTENEMSRSDFARIVGVSEVSICRYIANQRMPKRDVLSKIMEATNGAVTPNDFVRHEVENHETAA